MLIRCPECGQQVSDKAPVCPHCGVELQQILKTVTPESTVSQLYNNVNQQPQQQPQQVQQPQQQPQQVQQPQQPTDEVTKPEPEQPKNKAKMWLIGIICAMVVLGGIFYVVNPFANNGEEEAYRTAMQSDDLNVLNGYLADFHDAPQEHRDSVEARIIMINGVNKEWQDVLVSNSRMLFQQWVDEHPDGPFKAEAMHKLDSMDYQAALKANTVEALNDYIDKHSNGEFVDDAQQMVKDLSANTLQSDEKQMITSTLKSFFQHVNANDGEGASNYVSSLLNSFLGKSNATKGDVATFVKKLWKEDVQNMNWSLNNDFNIQKKEIGEGEYEYSVDFSAAQNVEKTSGSTTNNYKISAKLNTDGKITDLSMKKIVTE